MPLHICIHPSGMLLAKATENYVWEYAITDSHLTVLRKIAVKLAFTAPNGTAYVNNAPASLVQYSHSGHLLAFGTSLLFTMPTCSQDASY